MCNVLIATSAAIMMIGSGLAAAADFGYVEVIGIKTVVEPYSPNPSVEPGEGGVEVYYDPSQFDPEFDPPSAPPPPDTGQILPVLPNMTTCAAHLAAFVNNPEYVQPLLDFETCVTNLGLQGPVPYLLAYLIPVTQDVLSSFNGIYDDIAEVTQAVTVNLDPGSIECLDDQRCITLWLRAIADQVVPTVSVDKPIVRQYVVSCHMAVELHGESPYIDFSGRTGCTDSVGYPGLSSNPVTLSGQAEIRDLVSGVLVEQGPLSTTEPRSSLFAYTSRAKSRDFFFSWNAPLTFKIKYKATIDAGFPACAAGAPVCNTSWLVIPNKSISTTARLVCNPSGEALDCELDSAPLSGAVAEQIPETMSVGG